MRKSVLLASFAVVSFSVLGMENISNFGYLSPFRSPERNRLNVNAETTQKLNPSKKQDISTIFGDTVQKFLNGELNDKQKKDLVVSLFGKAVDQEKKIRVFTKRISSLENMYKSFLQGQMHLLQRSVNSVQTYLDSHQNIPLNGTNLHNSNIDFSLNPNVSKDASPLKDSLNSLNLATTSVPQETSSDKVFLPVPDNSSQQESLPFPLDFEHTDMLNLNLDALDPNNFDLTDLDLSNLDFCLLNDIDPNIAHDSGIKTNQPLSAVLSSPNSATEKQETSASQNTDRKEKRKAEESEDVQEPAEKIRRDDQSFRDPNAATPSQNSMEELNVIDHQEDVMRCNQAKIFEQKITLTNWTGWNFNPKKLVDLCYYLTDENFDKTVDETYIAVVRTALGIMSMLTDQQREYVKDFARNIHNPDYESNGEIPEIIVNTGHKDVNIISLINRIKELERSPSDLRNSNPSVRLCVLLVAMAQMDFPVQPWRATDEELNDFEGTKQTFIAKYNEEKRNLDRENQEDPAIKRRQKTNLVNAIRSLRRLGINDSKICSLLGLDTDTKFEKISPTLFRSFTFQKARDISMDFLIKMELRRDPHLSKNQINRTLSQLLGGSNIMQNVERLERKFRE